MSELIFKRIITNKENDRYKFYDKDNVYVDDLPKIIFDNCCEYTKAKKSFEKTHNTDSIHLDYDGSVIKFLIGFIKKVVGYLSEQQIVDIIVDDNDFTFVILECMRMLDYLRCDDEIINQYIKFLTTSKNKKLDAVLISYYIEFKVPINNQNFMKFIENEITECIEKYISMNDYKYNCLVSKMCVDSYLSIPRLINWLTRHKYEYIEFIYDYVKNPQHDPMGNIIDEEIKTEIFQYFIDSLAKNQKIMDRQLYKHIQNMSNMKPKCNYDLLPESIAEFYINTFYENGKEKSVYEFTHKFSDELYVTFECRMVNDLYRYKNPFQNVSVKKCSIDLNKYNLYFEYTHKYSTVEIWNVNDDQTIGIKDYRMKIISCEIHEKIKNTLDYYIQNDIVPQYLQEYDPDDMAKNNMIIRNLVKKIMSTELKIMYPTEINKMKDDEKLMYFTTAVTTACVLSGKN